MRKVSLTKVTYFTCTEFGVVTESDPHSGLPASERGCCVSYCGHLRRPPPPPNPGKHTRPNVHWAGGGLCSVSSWTLQCLPFQTSSEPCHQPPSQPWSLRPILVNSSRSMPHAPEGHAWRTRILSPSKTRPTRQWRAQGSSRLQELAMILKGFP